VRRLLTAEAGISKERVSFLGYWKVGGPLVG
jgi:NADPH-dependent ferric siderophore reductase